ncbi:hypothetical protein BDP55DRAFT_409741 [Colletotrichum godetiae]|uniref:Uncharacterized protein n=1 Tax=Colletotrichum godetiae TaxID=1209918 RepID=A0AAJ0EW41_9PEZI|nr:uncharacterized protein BDP55DRAFT_409741 [Colletotrichum godetiae]KAK1689484.1 hypothetical protein BDP55DRAFT_409741 [Colletotrichum godetiae]
MDSTMEPLVFGLAIFFFCIASTVQKEAMDSPMPVLHQSSFQACSCHLPRWPILQGIPKQLLFIHCDSFSAPCMRLSQLLLQYTQGGGVLHKLSHRRKKGPWGFFVLKKCKGNGVSRGL